MSQYEHQFLTSIIDKKCADLYVNLVRPSIFFNIECKLVWDSICEYYTKFNATSPRVYISRAVPSFNFIPSEMEPGAIFEIVKSAYVKNKLNKALEDLTMQGDDLITDPLAFIAQMMEELEETAKNIVTEDQLPKVGECVTDVIRRYKGELSSETNNLPFPWEPMQKSTYGAAPSSYTIFIARLKNFKSWILLIIITIWAIGFNRKCVIFTKEMSKEKLWDRILCILARVSWERFMSKELTPVEEDLIETLGYELKEMNIIHIEKIGDFSGKEAVREIARLCKYHDMKEGDILAIDGLYFYSSNDVFTMRTFSQSLRSLLLDTKYIGIFTTQANSNFEMSLNVDPGKITNLGDACMQDCTTGISMELNEDEQELTMATIATRDGKKRMWVINAMPCENFTLKLSDDPEEDEHTKINIPAKKDLDRVLAMLGERKHGS